MSSKIIISKKKIIAVVFVVLLLTAIFISMHKKGDSIIFPNAKITAAKLLFNATESPSFTLNLGEKTDLRFASIALASEEPVITHKVIDNNKMEAVKLIKKIKKENDSKYSLSLTATNSFKPGKYTLQTSIKTSEGKRILTQDFNWGVLAINTNKSIYTPKEIVDLAFSVLNEGGFNVCDAKIRLIITDPLGSKKELLTDNNGIKRHDSCQASEATYLPDYFAEYQTASVGTYAMQLFATTKNGTFSTHDYFQVRKNTPYDIERITATRINPVKPYIVKLKILANDDFSGEIVEKLPIEFDIIQKDKNALHLVERKAKVNLLKWTVTLKKGERLELSYTYKAPQISPQFYLAGPLQIGNFKEARQWQIAADPTKLLLLWDNNVATPSGWTCISCSTGDTFFQKFIRGAASYNASGGGSNSHSATVNTTTVNATATERGTASTTTTASTAHAHTATTTPGSANNIPVFRSLRVISYDAGIPTGASAIPAGAIALFDATVPTGWTRYSAQDGSYVRGDWTITTGGSNSHTHTVTWGAPGASTGTVLTGTTNTRASTNGHTHTAPTAGATVSTDCNTNACEPPFINTILGKVDSTTAIPLGMTGMFDGPPGAGWQDASQTGQGFNNILPKPATTYGTTGGSATHTHANTISGATGGPSATAQGTNSGTGAASEAHTHTVTTSFTADSNLPVYVDVQMAEKIVGISGTVKQSDESTAIGNPPCSGATNVIEARVNGGVVGAATVPCSSFDSSYSLSATASATDIVTIYLNSNSTPKANTIVRLGSASDLVSVDLFQNAVVGRDDSGSGITNTNLGLWDNDNDSTNMLFTSNTNNYSGESNIELHIFTGDTYLPGGTVTTAGTGNLHVDDSATATLDTATNTIGNDIVIDASATLNINANLTVTGSLTNISTGIINHTANSPIVTVSGTSIGGGSGNITFYRLQKAGVGTTTFSGSGTNVINNSLDATAGTFTLSTTNAITVASDVSASASATLNINANLTVTGSLTNISTGIINHTANSPIVTVSGTSIGGGSGNITFYRLQKAGVGTTTFSGSGTNVINNSLDATAGTFTLSPNNVITVAGNVSASTSATLNQNTALTINGGNLLTSGTGVINTTAGTGTVTMSGNGTIGGGGTVAIYNLVINGGETLASTTTSSTDVSVANGASIALGSQNLNVNGGDFTTTGTGTITCSGCSAGTVTVSTTGSLGGGNGAITFYNLTTSGTGTTTFSGGGTNSVLNNVSVGAGTTLNINSSVSIAGSLTNTTSGIIGTTAGTPTVTMTGTGTIGGGTTGAISIYALSTSGTGTTTFTSSP